jgi:hypothetical protein
MVAMEVLFLNNLLKATEDLGEDEILFSPVGPWTGSLRKEIGVIVEDDEEIENLTDSDFDSLIEYFGIFHKFLKMDEIFLYALKPRLILDSWNDLLGRVRKNERYLKSDISKDAELITFLGRLLGKYDLLVCNNLLTHINTLEKEFVRSIVEGEVSEKLAKGEVGKRGYYIEAIRNMVGIYELLKEPTLVASIPQSVKEKGVSGIIGHIREGNVYVESVAKRKNILTIFYADHRRKGIEIETNMSVEYDTDLVYVVFVGVHNVLSGKNYLIGFPFFKGKISKITSIFRPVISTYRGSSSFVEIKRKEKTRTGKSGFLAELKVETFEVNAFYASNFRVIEEEGKKRNIWLHEGYGNKVVQARASRSEEGREAKYNEYKICDIEVRGDGSLSVRTDYNKAIEVLIMPTFGGQDVEELREMIDKGNIVIGGRILKEYSKGSGGREVILEDKKNLGEVDKYIAYTLIKFLEKALEKAAKYKSRDSLSFTLSKEKEEEKSLIDTIKTPFIYYKARRTLESLKKIVNLCFESEGRKYHVKTHDIKDPKEMTRKAVNGALYSTGIEPDGLRGVNKSIVDVLKLISYSYPLMDRPNIESLLEKLKNLANIIFSTEDAPLDEISVLISKINPDELDKSSEHGTVPSISAVFLVEGDAIKAYVKGHGNNWQGVKRLRIGLGDIEVNI